MSSMSSPVSQISFTSSPNGSAQSYGTRFDPARPSFSSNPEQGGASSFSAEPEPFARTLQNQINNRPQGPQQRLPGNDNADATRHNAARSESSRNEASRGERSNSSRDTAASRNRPGEAARESSRQPESTTQAGNDSDAAVSETAARSSNTAADSGAQDKGGEAGQALPAQDTNVDPAAVLAGLPAAFAALNQAITETSPSEGDPLLEGGGQKLLGQALSEPLLQTKPETKTTGLGLETGTGTKVDADAGAAAVPLLQARPAVTAAFAERLGAGAALAEEGGAKALSSVSGSSSQTHGVHVFNMLRNLPASQAATPQLPVQTPASSQAWAEDVGNQVRWMLGRAESKAELVLTPPNLGKLEVSISLAGDQTTAHFVASSQAARDALEQALPRLREMLQQAGIQLNQSNVSTSGEQSAQGNADGGSRGGRHGGEGQIADAGSEGSHVQWLRQHDGMVDTFA